MIKKLVGVFTLSVMMTGMVSAESIGWNFTSDWSSPTIQGDGIADGFDQWTDSVDEANSPGGTEVPNSTDPYAVTIPINAAGVTVAWSSSNMYSAGAETNPDQGLYRVYLDDGLTGPLVTVSGLTAWMASVPGATGYKLDIYRTTDIAANTFAEVNIYNGLTTGGSLLETLAPEAGFEGNYPTDTGGGGSRLKQTATSIFTGDAFTFHTDRDLGLGGQRAGVAGFKITTVNIPEPTIFVMVVVFGGLLLGRRLKK